MAWVGFFVFLAFLLAGLFAGMEIHGYGSANGWPALWSFALAIPVSGLIVFAGVLANGAIGFLAKRR
jgi:hypothetical protein